MREPVFVKPMRLRRDGMTDNRMILTVNPTPRNVGNEATSRACSH